MAGNFAFLASTLHVADFRELRRELHREGKEADKRIWVAEFDARDLRQDEGLTPLDIVDRCLDEIDASEWFFLLVGDSFGSAVATDQGHFASSYTELELFYAVIREKPIALLFPEGANVGGGLAALIDALQFGFDAEPVVGRSAIIDFVKRMLNEPRKAKSLSKQRARRLSGALALQRHLDPNNDHLFAEMEFLDGRALDLGRPRADLDLVRACLDDLRRQTRTDRKMSRAWLALRELMGRHYATTDDPETLRLWAEALKAWSQFAGWKGLHAHLYLGHIATLGSLSRVIERQGVSPSKPRGHEHSDNLCGAFASVYYSLSKISPQDMASNFLERSFAYIEHGLDHADEADQSGLLAIRGSIHMRRRDIGAARQDYERALGIVESFRPDEKSAGELMVELAWAEFNAGHLLAARRRAEDGVTVLSAAGVRDGFMVRALRKLAYIRAATAAPIGAYRAALQAGHLIQAIKLEDQTGPETALALAIERRFSGRRVGERPDA